MINRIIQAVVITLSLQIIVALAVSSSPAAQISDLQSIPSEAELEAELMTAMTKMTTTMTKVLKGN